MIVDEIHELDRYQQTLTLNRPQDEATIMMSYLRSQTIYNLFLGISGTLLNQSQADIQDQFPYTYFSEAE